MAQIRRQTARIQRETRRSNAAFYFIIVFQLLVIFALFFALRVNSNKLKLYTDSEKVDADATRSMEPMDRIYTNDGTPIDLYVMKDPDRGTEFVVGSRGGVCVRP